MVWRDTAEERCSGGRGPGDADRRDARAARPARGADAAGGPGRRDPGPGRGGDALSRRPGVDEPKARGYRAGRAEQLLEPGRHVIERAGLDHLFDTLALSFRVSLAKPEPADLRARLRGAGRRTRRDRIRGRWGVGELDAARALGIVTVLIEQAAAAPTARARRGTTRWTAWLRRRSWSSSRRSCNRRYKRGGDHASRDRQMYEGRPSSRSACWSRRSLGRWSRSRRRRPTSAT